ncbi:MAG: FAD-dependent oxidoreductase [Deltaproteobacteria bacterium]|nr:FAD-dependent oxidoreductase [Deltaproteobacteria bacterium]
MNKNVSQTKLPVYIARSRQTTEVNKTGSWRVMCPEYEEKTSPCSAACPAGEDIALIQMLTARGLLKKAWEKILMENPFPAVCGRVCYHPCETVCNRKQFDEPVAINSIERFLSDTADKNGYRPFFEKPETKKEKIAIIGAGPAGLSAAWFLSRMGYPCDIFEEKSEPGGILRWGIPAYRLPAGVLQREIDLIVAAGAEIHCNRPVSGSFLADIKKKYNAVFMGCGHGQSERLNIEGENPAVDGLDFLSELRQGKARQLHGRVVVLGGGNTAVDVARSVLRLGGTPLIIYRRRREDMPAFPQDVNMALEEGVELLELYGPAKIEKNNKDYSLTLQKMHVVGLEDGKRAAIEPDAGKTKKINAQMVVKAIGAGPAETWHKPPVAGKDILNLSNAILSFDNAGFPVVFGGDLASEIESVVHAVASGKHAAIALDILFNKGRNNITKKMEICSVGNGSSFSFETYLNRNHRPRRPETVSYEQINTDYFSKAQRITVQRLPKEEAINSFAEIALNIPENFAVQEAARCFNCGICTQCDNCFIFCPDVAVIHDKSKQGRHINYDYCKGCGLCVAECPRSAMTLKGEHQ